MINADGAPYGNDNAAKGHTQNPGNRMPRGTVNDYNEAKKVGNVVMKYKAGKQAKHRKGSKEYVLPCERVRDSIGICVKILDKKIEEKQYEHGE